MTPRGQYNRNKQAITPVIATLLPQTTFTELPWWGKLSGDEQSQVITEGQALAQAMLNHTQSRIAIGEHLLKVQTILEPHGLFGRFLRGFHFSTKTAYRYIAGFKNAQERLPEPVLKAAMARGINIIGDTAERPLGVYTDAVKALPPSPTMNDAQAVTYLDQLESVRRTTPSQPQTITVQPLQVDLAVKIAYKTVANLVKRLPADRKGQNKQRFLQTVVGMLMTEMGIASAQTFTPQAVPDEFKVGRGRPRQVPAAA